MGLARLPNQGNRPPLTFSDSHRGLTVSAITLADEAESFLHYLAVERAASPNTVQAYEADLRKYRDFAASGGIEDYLAPTIGELTNFLDHLARRGLAPASVARNLGTIKSFYLFLRMEGRTADETVSLMERPNLWQRLPKVLPAAKIQELLREPYGTRYDYRDVAILEFLYATGARASELCDVKLEDLNLLEKQCLLFGKGNKQRMVLLGQAVILALNRYFRYQRPRLARLSTEPPWVFLTRSGKRLDRSSFTLCANTGGRSARRCIRTCCATASQPTS